jgi:hypothetical protein
MGDRWAGAVRAMPAVCGALTAHGVGLGACCMEVKATQTAAFDFTVECMNVDEQGNLPDSKRMKQVRDLSPLGNC